MASTKEDPKKLKKRAEKEAAAEAAKATPPAKFIGRGHGPQAPVEPNNSPLERLRQRLALSGDANVDDVCETALGELERLSAALAIN